MPPPESILVISLRYFGDVLLVTPLIRTLRQAYPGAAIDALVFAGTEGMLEGNPDLRRVATIAERASGREQRALLRSLWRGYDLAVVAETGDRPHLYGWIAGRRRVGLLPPEPLKRWWKRHSVERGVTAIAREARHRAYARLADALEIQYLPALVVPSAGTAAQELSALLGFDAGRQRYAVLQLAPRFHYKRWDAGSWRALIAWLRKAGLQVVVTGGNASEERSYVRSVLAGEAAHVVDLAGRLRFAQTADLLRGAALFVGPDTATTHLAAACGTPTVALFGPTDPGIWGPLPPGGLKDAYAPRAPLQRRENVLLVQASALPCVPCQQEGCERHRLSHSACLDLLQADRVIEATRQLLSPGAS